jgi:methionyl-tRNA formyltransferase
VSQATYCKKIDKEDGSINWSNSAKEIYQMWQAYTPWPGIYTMYDGKRLLLERVSESSPPEKVSSPPLLGGELYRRRELEWVTQKGIHNNVTPPGLPFSGEEPNP